MWTLLALLSSLTAHAQDPYRAVAGAPLLAYVGDQVELSAEWSTGPEPKIYAWEQIEGPPAALDDPAAERPRFLAEHAGTYLFEVTVGDDATRSGPARSIVSVVDRDLRDDDAGCRAAPLPGGLVGLLALVALRRRR
jgi:hypothetical protein